MLEVLIVVYILSFQRVVAECGCSLLFSVVVYAGFVVCCVLLCVVVCCWCGALCDATVFRCLMSVCWFVVFYVCWILFVVCWYMIVCCWLLVDGCCVVLGVMLLVVRVLVAAIVVCGYF